MESRHLYEPGDWVTDPTGGTGRVLSAEDGAYDLMRAMNIRRRADVPEDLKLRMERMLAGG